MYLGSVRTGSGPQLDAQVFGAAHEVDLSW